MALRIVLVLVAFIPENDTQEQIRELEDRVRQFPPAEAVAEIFELSREHVCWLHEAGAAIPSHRREAHAAHLADAERLHHAWLSLAEATRKLKQARHLADGGRKDNPFKSKLAASQRAIEDLETLLGEEDFRAGRMPPPVPIWWFQWID